MDGSASVDAADGVDTDGSDAVTDVRTLSCSNMPAPRVLAPPSTRDCGPNCTIVSESTIGHYGEVAEADGNLVFGTSSILWSMSRQSRSALWDIRDQLRPFCSEPDGLVSTWSITQREFVAICFVHAADRAIGYDFVSVDRATGRGCRLARLPPGDPQLAQAPRGLVRLTGAFAWHEVSDGPETVRVLDEGATTSRELRSDRIRNVQSTVGGRDYLIVVNGNLNSRQVELWISRPPFRTIELAMESPSLFGMMASDPENPTHLVFSGAVNPTRCGAGADIWYLDVSTSPLVPRNLTNDSATQIAPVIRGDRVAWSDFRNSPTLPNACSDVDPEVSTIVVGSVQNPANQTEVHRSDLPASPVLIGAHDVYFIERGKTAVVPLP